MRYRVLVGGIWWTEAACLTEARAPDLLITNEAHYQLCYWGKPVFFRFSAPF